ncbi:MAG: diadenylate cyclase CdaA [Acidobacteriota bacterium]
MDALTLALDRALSPFQGWQDVLDVLLVAFVLYYLLLLIRGTRAVQVVFGILSLLLVYFFSDFAELQALETTLEKFFELLPIAILILFQHEIRRALAGFGRAPIFTRGSGSDPKALINDVAVAAATLSNRKTGALIVFERQQGLRNHIENGIALDARVSLDLLVTLFHPETPTHDGATIIQGDRIAAATCFLPLTRNAELSKALGTRHRAALGITEESDAVAVVVSEETGDISVAVGGRLERRVSSSSLATLLFQHLVADPQRGAEVMP